MAKMSLETALWLTPCLQVFPSAALVAVSEFCFLIVDKTKRFLWFEVFGDVLHHTVKKYRILSHAVSILVLRHKITVG